MKAGWALLRRRDFGLLWAGGLISETGDWFLLVGLPVWVLQITGSSLVTATVFLVGLLPGLVVGPLAGVLVDRWDHRRTLVAVSLAQAALLLPLLAVDGRDRLWIVYLVMAVEAALGQLNDPARNALVPSLVAKADLVGANALIGLNGNLARLVGSPLGGILVEVAGLPGLVVGDAVSFLVGAALIALVRPDVSGSRAGSDAVGSQAGTSGVGGFEAVGFEADRFEAGGFEAGTCDAGRAHAGQSHANPRAPEPALAVPGPPKGEPNRQAARAPGVVHSPAPTLAAPGWCGSGWMGSG